MNSFLDTFVPLRALGHGGMGEVWEVRHRSSGQAFAVKFARERPDSSERDRLAFEREVRAQSQVHHPRVLPVLAFGELTEPLLEQGLDQPAGTRWCAFECVRGGTLASSGVEPDKLRVVLLRILDALAHCHALGLAHLDLKPENLLWRHDPTDVVLADFGIAQLMGRQDKVTGTPSYMAPEQWLSGELDGRTDLYAVGCLAYRLAMGIPPFLGPPIRVREAHCRHPLPSTDDEAFDTWIGRLCAKDPDQRFQSAATAAAALPRRLFLEPGAPEHFASTEPELTALFTPSERVRVDLTPGASVGFPVPADWRTPQMGLHSIGTLGLGGLGVREVPVLGREALQDALWNHARAVARGDGARLVTLVGPGGAGRSRLLRWLRVRLRELDAAIVLDAPQAYGPDLPFAIRLTDDASPATLRALETEAEGYRESHARVLLVATTEAHDSPGILLQVPPLAIDSALALASAWVALSPTAAADLVERSGRLPGAMAWELEARMSTGGLISHADGLAFVGPPPDPTAPLNPDEAAIVGSAAALPLPVASRVVAMARSLGVRQPTATLWALLRRGLLREQGVHIHPSSRCPSVPETTAVRQAALDTSTDPTERILHASFLTPAWEPLATALTDPEIRLAGPLVEALVERAPAVFQASGLPPDHLCWGDLGSAVAAVARDAGDLEGTRAAVEALRLGPPTWARPLGRALTVYADLLGRKSELDAGWSAVQEAQATLASSGTSRELVLCQTAAALIAMNRFDWDGAAAALEAGEQVPGATAADLSRLLPWRRALLASTGHSREALELTMDSLRANPGYYGLWCSVPLLYWELGEPERAVALLDENLELPRTIRRILQTLACLSLVALGRFEEADAATLTPDPGYSESSRRHVRLVCAAPRIEMPFDLLLLACTLDRLPCYDDVWETWLLRTAAWRAREAGLLDRAERAEAAADRRAARLPADLQARIPPPGPFR